MIREVVMAEELDPSERIWRCACHYSPHFVSVAVDPIAPDIAGDPDVFGWFLVEVTDGPWTLRHRIREAWKILRLRGHRYTYGDVLLDPHTAQSLAQYLQRLTPG